MFVNLKKAVQVGLISATFFFTLSAQAEVSDTTKLANDPAVVVGKLSNGLTYYIRPNNKPEKRLELRLVVNAGSILETEKQRGLAHFVEHMAFNGSTHFKKNDLVSYLQSIGVKFGGDLNAYTSFDETVYILPIPTEDKANVDKGFLVLEDWASGLSFNAAEIEKERGVILEELRLRGKNAGERTQNKLLPKIFENSLYAERLPKGLESVISTASADTMKSFYNDWYRPDLMSVVVVGDISSKDAKAYIEKHFGHLKNPKNEAKRVIFDVPARQKSDAIVITDKENTRPLVQIIGGSTNSEPQKTLADFQKTLFKKIIFEVLNQRLQEKRQLAKPPFIGAGTFTDNTVRKRENFMSVAIISEEGTESAIRAVIAENERMRQFGVTPAELERAKLSFLKAYETDFNEREKTNSAVYVQQYVDSFLSDQPILSQEAAFNYVKQTLQNINIAEVNKLAATIIPNNGKALLALVAPETNTFTLPDATQLTSQLNNAFTQKITAYEEKVLQTQLMTAKPTPGKLIKESKTPAIGLTTLEFSNGTTVLLKPTDFKNDQILLSAYRDGGSNGYSVADQMNAGLAGQINGITGYGDFSPTDIQKMLAGKVANIGRSFGEVNEGISGTSNVADFETMLQLLFISNAQGRNDPVLFESFRTKVKQVIPNLANDPGTAFNDFYNRALYNNHPLSAQIPSMQQVEDMKLSRILDIYSEHYGNANGMNFVIAGSFDIEKIKPLLATYIGGLPSDLNKTFKYADAGMRPIKGSKRVTLNKGADQKSNVQIIYTGDLANYSMKESYSLWMLDEVLQIKLNETLREKLSLVYNVDVSNVYLKKPYSRFTFMVSATAAPDNVEALITATKAEIENLRKNGPSAADVLKVKTNYLTNHAINLKENSYWLSTISNFQQDGIDLAQIPGYGKEIVEKLGPKDIQNAAKQFLGVENVFEAVLMPENAKK
jgi:zinc protease